MQNLITEVFCGEFGWECFVWQGYLRYLAQQGNRLFVNCEAGKEFLYFDFAYKIRSWPRMGSIRDMWKNKDWPKGFSDNKTNTVQYWSGFEDIAYELGDYSLIRNDRYQTRNWSVIGSEFFKSQRLIYFDKRLSPITTFETWDVLIHARNLYKYDTQYRNWKIKDLEQYVNAITKLGYKIAFVGLKSESFSIEGVPNFQNISLDLLAQLMSKSRMIIGPVSGPIHFATLCELSQVTWVTKAEHAQRVKKTWNPFNTTVSVYYAGKGDIHWKQKTYWIPPVSKLVEATQRMVELQK
jgi:hypothetical protein